MNTKTDPEYRSNDLQSLGQDFLLALKMEEPVGEHLVQFDQIPYSSLVQELSTDKERLAFWINVYNGFNLHLMKTDPATHSVGWERMKHFSRAKIRIAGLRLSLMNIENDILRKGRHWWGLGYTRKLFRSSRWKQMQVDIVDPRIHFALNCGATSCPPIRFYSADEIEVQLELASRGYLQTEVHFDPANPKQIRVAGIFRLYPGDFGGKTGIVNWIRKYRKDLPEGKLEVVWEKYDNTLDLDSFTEQ